MTYDISPYKGSEASVSWNYVFSMQHYHKLTVLYGKGKEDIEHYLQTNSMKNVTFYNLSPLPTTGNKLAHHISYNLNYMKWQKNAYHQVKKWLKDGRIDIVHYLNPIGFKEPGFLWKLPIPYIWGPLQAVENLPLSLFPALSFKEKSMCYLGELSITGLLFCYLASAKPCTGRIICLQPHQTLYG